MLHHIQYNLLIVNFLCDFYIGTTVRIEESAKLPADAEMRVVGPTKWIHTVPRVNEEGHQDFCCR